MDRFDFVIVGIPRTRQARRGGVRRAWTKQVREAATRTWPPDRRPYDGEVGIIMIYFYRDQTNIDIDNVAKPILDALNGLLIEDDVLVSQLMLRKTDQNLIDPIRDPPAVLAGALGEFDNFVYVSLSDPPNHSEVPIW